MWHAGSNEIHDLVNYSTRKFGVELPLGKEILHLNSFCWELSVLFNKGNDSVEVEICAREPKNAVLRWFHRTFSGSRTETLELPEDAIWEIHGNLLKILDAKCEQLAEMCGWYKEHPKEER